MGKNSLKTSICNSYFLLHRLIKMVVFTYFIRNLYLFLYDIYVASIKITPVENADEKYLDFVLQVMNVALRGSLAQFFYVQIFTYIEPPKVCDNVTIPFQGPIQKSASHALLKSVDGNKQRQNPRV